MNILVTTDGSERSLDILPHVQRLVTRLGGNVTLLRVLNPLVDLGGELGLDLDAAGKRAAKAWNAEMNSVLSRFGLAGESVVVELGRGEDVDAAILRIAVSRGDALVAMHSRGSGALRHALLGSVAMAVLGKTSIPLMLTGGAASVPAERGGYHLVATSDGSPASTAILPALSALIAGTDAKVTLLRVCEPRSGRPGPEAEIEVAKAQLESLRPGIPGGVTVEVCCRTCDQGEEVAQAIVTASLELRADAIAMATQGQSAFRHLLAGSVALSVLERSPLPVIMSRG